jgi:hypothetical protein
MAVDITLYDDQMTWVSDMYRESLTYFERMNQLKDAGKRWIAEIIFSSIKRVLGEDLLSKKFCAQKVEARLKVMLYNKFISL